MTDGQADPAVARMKEYLSNAFLPRASEPLQELPLPDESHVASWRAWLAGGDVTPSRLAERLPQLVFGVQEGLSKGPEYRRAILSADLDALPESAFDPIGPIEVAIEAHWAGHLPVVTTTEREDFKYLFETLANRGEPMDISSQVHASMIVGLVSPVRVVEARRAWEEGSLQKDPLVADCSNWPEAMKAIDGADRTRFRERLLIMHGVEYAGLRAEDVDADLDEAGWVRKSRIIRQEHEFTHYATRRLFDNMRLNLHDEIIADCMGFTSAFGRFDSSLFLHGLGIDDSLRAASDGRVRMYVGDLDEDQVADVCALAASAARMVEAVLDQGTFPDRAILLQALAATSLEQLAGEEGRRRLESIV